MLAALLFALSLAQAPQLPSADSGAFPAGTRIPIRFLEAVSSGRDSVGTLVRAQTMAPLTAGGCVLVPQFSPVYGTVDQSVGGRLFGRRGSLHLRFDSLRTAPSSWASISAILDSLEWAGPGRVTDSGTFYGNRRSLKQVAGTTGGAGVVATATGVGAIPVVALTGFKSLRRGAQAQILAAQEGVLRLTAAVVFSGPDRCAGAREGPVSSHVPSLLPLPARTTNKAGNVLGDPINVLVQGTRADLDAAFARAGWLPADHPTAPHLAQGVGAAIAGASAPRAPMSHQYYLGRIEDLAFERASPSARKRHHVRVWQADTAGTLWASAANEDVGLLINPLKGRATHRIAPAIDHERDLLAREVLASGCAGFEGYTSLPGAVRAGTNVAGQAFATDGRTVVLGLRQCPEPEP